MTSSAAGGAIDISISVAELGRSHDALDRRAEEMARLGVSHGVVVADRRGPRWRPDAVIVDAAAVADAVARHPDRYSGAIGVDPTPGPGAARALRDAVEAGFVAAHIVPHAFGISPNNSSWYPTYAACAELGIPVQVELGVRRSAGTRLRSVGRPIALDDVACDFPELTIIGLGPWPWVEEAISLAYKHRSVYVAIGADHPEAPDPSLVRFADSWGGGKVMFASSGAPLAAALDRVAAVGMRPASIEACLRDTAARVFRFGDT